MDTPETFISDSFHSQIITSHFVFKMLTLTLPWFKVTLYYTYGHQHASISNAFYNRAMGRGYLILVVDLN